MFKDKMSLTPTHGSDHSKVEAADLRQDEIRLLSPAHHHNVQATGWEDESRSLTPSNYQREEQAPEWRHESASKHPAGITLYQ